MSRRNPTQAARPAPKPAAKPAPAAPPTIFLPTLLPDPFGESSPELCWEWNDSPARVTARLTQFGWHATAFVEGSAVMHWTADSLADLREEVVSALVEGLLHPAFEKGMSARWALAYEVAGFQ